MLPKTLPVPTSYGVTNAVKTSSSIVTVSHLLTAFVEGLMILGLKVALTTPFMPFQMASTVGKKSKVHSLMTMCTGTAWHPCYSGRWAYSNCHCCANNLVLYGLLVPTSTGTTVWPIPQLQKVLLHTQSDLKVGTKVSWEVKTVEHCIAERQVLTQLHYAVQKCALSYFSRIHFLDFLAKNYYSSQH